MSDDLVSRAEQLIADDCLPLTGKLTKQLVDLIKELEASRDDYLQAWKSAMANRDARVKELDALIDRLRQHNHELDLRAERVEAERDRLAEENMNAQIAHGAMEAIHELLDSGGIPRGTFADDHVRNLVAKYNNLAAAYKDRENERDAIEAATIEKACTAVAGLLPIGGLLSACQRAIRALSPTAHD